MARYIDADKLLIEIKKRHTVRYFSPTKEDLQLIDIFEIINTQPTADVVEVTKVVEMLCKIKTNIIKNVSTMIENDFSEIVKDALGERRDT